MNEVELQRLHATTELILQGTNTNLLSTYNKIQPMLYMMLGEVWCGIHGQHYVYICDSRLDARDVAEQFVQLLREDNEAYAQTYHFMSDPVIVVTRTRQTFNFIPYQKALIDEYWIGAVCDRVYINTSALSLSQLGHLHMDIISIGADYI